MISNVDKEAVKMDLLKFSYLSQEKAEEIVDFFEKMGFGNYESYPGGVEFGGGFKKASLLRTEGVIFTTTSSTSSPTIVSRSQDD